MLSLHPDRKPKADSWKRSRDTDQALHIDEELVSTSEVPVLSRKVFQQWPAAALLDRRVMSLVKVYLKEQSFSSNNKKQISVMCGKLN
jgi:hypothetical protein